jgi:hypothetical protein
MRLIGWILCYSCWRRQMDWQELQVSNQSQCQWVRTWPCSTSDIVYAHKFCQYYRACTTLGMIEFIFGNGNQGEWWGVEREWRRARRTSDGIRGLSVVSKCQRSQTLPPLLTNSECRRVFLHVSKICLHVVAPTRSQGAHVPHRAR